ncbi:MAG: hypothetical protein IPN17_07325 [Deltaproteobacteria bacterium]|nr:hypothetical protein [Deltaproteobacteria bacterium]
MCMAPTVTLTPATTDGSPVSGVSEVNAAPSVASTPRVMSGAWDDSRSTRRKSGPPRSCTSSSEVDIPGPRQRPPVSVPTR